MSASEQQGPGGEQGTEVGRIAVRVSRKELVAARIVALTLERQDGAPFDTWQPGAHIDVHLPGGLTRQYSLCPVAGNHASQVRVTVLREPDSRGGSEWIHEQLNHGDVVHVSQPRNNFTLAKSRKYLFVAGGIGITPLLSMIEHVDGIGCEWTLHYLGSDLANMAYASELQQRFGADKVILHESTVSGRLDLATILATPRAHMLVYVCGPTGLVSEVEDYCLGWPPGVLHSELFSNAALDLGGNSASFEVEMRLSGRTLTVSPTESVLEVLEAQGVRIMSSCRSGLCGTCEVTVVDGTVDHRDVVLDEETKSAGDVMLVCVSRAAAGCSRLTLGV